MFFNKVVRFSFRKRKGTINFPIYGSVALIFKGMAVNGHKKTPFFGE